MLRVVSALLLAAPAFAADENVNAQVVSALGEAGVKALHEQKEKAYSDLMAKHPEIAAKAKQTQLKLVKQLDAIPQAQKVLKDACGVDNLTADENVKTVASRLVSDSTLYAAVSEKLDETQRGEMEQNIVAGYKELSRLILEKDPEWAEKQEAAAKAALKEKGVGEPQFAQITALELEVTKARLAQATKELAKQSKASKNNAALLAPQFPFGPFWAFPYAFPYVFMPPFNMTTWPAATPLTPAGYFLPYPFAPCWPFFPCVSTDDAEKKPSASA